MQGLKLLETIHSLPANAPAAVFLRHAERYDIVDVTDPAKAELTTKGTADAEALGGKIRGFDCIRLFHSPVKRCQQTAEAIARGVMAAGGSADIAGPEDALGIDYILDLKEAGRLTLLHGESFVRLWFSGEVPPNVIRAAEEIAAAKVTHLKRRLDEPCARGRRLDLHVSHDWNIIILRELLVGARHEDVGWLNYLDGVAFSAAPGGLRAVYRDRSALVSLPLQLNRKSL